VTKTRRVSHFPGALALLYSPAFAKPRETASISIWRLEHIPATDNARHARGAGHSPRGEH